jgi:hypothetical protein
MAWTNRSKREIDKYLLRQESPMENLQQAHITKTTTNQIKRTKDDWGGILVLHYCFVVALAWISFIMFFLYLIL